MSSVSDISIQLLLIVLENVWDRCVPSVFGILARKSIENSGTIGNFSSGSIYLVTTVWNLLWLKLTRLSFMLAFNYWVLRFNNLLVGSCFLFLLVNTTFISSFLFSSANGFPFSKKFWLFTTYLGVIQSGETSPQSDKQGDFVGCLFVNIGR